MDNAKLLEKLNTLFGSYRAEWLKSKIYYYFTEPSYFVTLKDHRPCVLQGGRGTGKTTVLKGLSYQGQYELLKNSIDAFDESNYIGIYHRANTNHVRAFKDGGLSVSKWQKMFGHYFNIIICREILLFISWHKSLSNNDEVFTPNICSIIAKSIHIKLDCTSFDILLEQVEIKMYEFQSMINNIDDETPLLSMAGDPIKIVTEYAINLSQFKGKMFYLLIDEYENFEDNQQQLLNTLIKHNTENYTFKIGVRELGWRVKHTLNPQELLCDPADYNLIDIQLKLTESDHFQNFAEKVCQKRIEELIEDVDKQQYSIVKSLISIKMEDEAILLGVGKSELLKDYSDIPENLMEKIKSLTPLNKFFLAYWASSHNKSLETILMDYLENTSEWKESYKNYKYEMLFKIKKGRGKGGIQKYYAGWDTYVRLANGNIRYLMELVYRAYEKHINENNKILSEVSLENQTWAAQEVGLKNLKELEGLCKNGAQLTKLLLGFGRIFNILACDSVLNRPEVSQFYIKGDDVVECNNIITDAVMNLALIRMPGNKLSTDTETRNYMYALHPIYAPYFVFSHRKKRKLQVSNQEVLEVSKYNTDTMKNIIERNSGKIDVNVKMPSDQLSLF